MRQKSWIFERCHRAPGFFEWTVNGDSWRLVSPHVDHQTNYAICEVNDPVPAECCDHRRPPKGTIPGQWGTNQYNSIGDERETLGIATEVQVIAIW